MHLQIHLISFHVVRIFACDEGFVRGLLTRPAAYQRAQFQETSRGFCGAVVLRYLAGCTHTDSRFHAAGVEL